MVLIPIKKKENYNGRSSEVPILMIFDQWPLHF